ncbi:ankyrin, partial [Cadophora sp. DSE1049]
TPLLLATQYRRSGLVRAFLQQGVNPDPHDYYGSSPLSIAARHCDARAVDLLLTLSRGCVDVNSRDHLGRTPLWWARRGGSDDVMELLLKGGADESSISARDNDVPVPIKAGPASNGSRFIRCDICTMCILDGDIYYHCGDCNFGDFDICQDCYQNGERCLETGHDLVQCPAVI